MDFRNLTTDEAFRLGIITRGRWNDYENWELEEPIWKKALALADQYHKMANSMYTDKSKERRSGNREPYIKFIQGVMNILINEAHIQDDILLSAGALYDVTVRTTCLYSVIEMECGTEIAEMVQMLRRDQKEKIGAYLDRCMEHEETRRLVCIILAVQLQEERVSDIFPFESWEEDLPYYKDLKDQIEPFIGVFLKRNWSCVAFLCRKLSYQINENMEFSRDRNKTAETIIKRNSISLW